MKRSGRSKRHLEGTAKLPRKWAAFVAALALAVLGIGAVSCGGSHRGRKGSSRPAASKTTARTNEPSAALPATGASSAVATADAGAGQSPGADVPSTEMAPERPPRNAAPGSTKGTIACGTVRCTLGQACIWEADTTRIGGNDESRWRCVPLGTSQAEVERVFQADHYLCDDSSDCGPRGACCFGFATGSENASCTPREGPRSECRNELCVEGDGAAHVSRRRLRGRARSYLRGPTAVPQGKASLPLVRGAHLRSRGHQPRRVQQCPPRVHASERLRARTAMLRGTSTRLDFLLRQSLLLVPRGRALQP
jgi:hypothetical protein